VLKIAQPNLLVILQWWVCFEQIAAGSHLLALVNLVLDYATAQRPERIRTTNPLNVDVKKVLFCAQRPTMYAQDGY
jgi:hypothetical protein